MGQSTSQTLLLRRVRFRLRPEPDRFSGSGLSSTMILQVLPHPQPGRLLETLGLGPGFYQRESWSHCHHDRIDFIIPFRSIEYTGCPLLHTCTNNGHMYTLSALHTHSAHRHTLTYLLMHTHTHILMHTHTHTYILLRHMYAQIQWDTIILHDNSPPTSSS